MWIKDRIDAEYKKHKDLDWSRLAEAKILATLTKELHNHSPQGKNSEKNLLTNCHFKEPEDTHAKEKRGCGKPLSEKIKLDLRRLLRFNKPEILFFDSDEIILFIDKKFERITIQKELKKQLKDEVKNE